MSSLSLYSLYISNFRGTESSLATIITILKLRDVINFFDEEKSCFLFVTERREASAFVVGFFYSFCLFFLTFSSTLLAKATCVRVVVVDYSVQRIKKFSFFIFLLLYYVSTILAYDAAHCCRLN